MHGSPERQVSIPIKVLYGLGDLSNGLKSAALGSLVIFFYNQVLGLDPFLASLAILISLVFDSLSDFLVGSISDGTRHKWGRRHPYLYASAIPFAISFFLIFSPPAGMGQVGLFCWLLVTTVLARLVITFYTVPHLALGAELSSNYHERTVIAGFRGFFSYVGMMGFFFGSKLLFSPTDEYTNGQMNPDVYPVVGLVFGLIAGFVILVSAFGTHSVIGRLPQTSSRTERISLRRLFNEVIGLLANPAYRIFVAACLTYMIGFGISRGLEIYLATYFWRLPTEHTFNLLLSSMAGLTVAAFVWPVLSQLTSKKVCFVGGAMVFSVLSILPIVLKLVGVFPSPDGPAYLGLIFAAAFLAAVLGGAVAILGGSMLADIADDHELRTGEKQAGVMFGGIHVSVKAGSGMGAIVTGFLLSIVGLSEQVDPAEVTSHTVIWLGLGAGGIVAAFGALAALICAQYPISRERHLQIQKELTVRRMATVSGR